MAELDYCGNLVTSSEYDELDRARETIRKLREGILAAIPLTGPSKCAQPGFYVLIACPCGGCPAAPLCKLYKETDGN